MDDMMCSKDAQPDHSLCITVYDMFLKTHFMFDQAATVNTLVEVQQRSSILQLHRHMWPQGC